MLKGQGLSHQIPLNTISLELKSEKHREKRKEVRRALCYSANLKKKNAGRSLQSDQPWIIYPKKKQTPTSQKSMPFTPQSSETLKSIIIHQSHMGKIPQTYIEKLGIDGCDQNKVPKTKKSLPSLPDQDNLFTQILEEDKKRTDRNISVHPRCPSSKRAQQKNAKKKQLYKTNQINLSSHFGQFHHPMCKKITISSINKIYEACLKEIQKYGDSSNMKKQQHIFNELKQSKKKLPKEKIEETTSHFENINSMNRTMNGVISDYRVKESSDSGVLNFSRAIILKQKGTSQVNQEKKKVFHEKKHKKKPAKSLNKKDNNIGYQKREEDLPVDGWENSHHRQLEFNHMIFQNS